MENTGEERMRESREYQNFEKSSRRFGYISDCDLEREEMKEYNILKNSETEDIFTPVFDMLKFIGEVLPRLPKGKDRIIIEKYLMGYTVKEIGETVSLSPTAVRYHISRHRPLLQEIYGETCAVKDLCENRCYIYKEPAERPKIDREVSRARIMLENLFGFDTYIYPFDISVYSYKITCVHPKYGRSKFSRDGFIKFAEHIKEKLNDKTI